MNNKIKDEAKDTLEAMENASNHKVDENLKEKTIEIIEEAITKEMGL